MMEAVRTSEMSVNIYLTAWQYIPRDSKLHTCCHENLKSHKFMTVMSLLIGRERELLDKCMFGLWRILMYIIFENEVSIEIVYEVLKLLLNLYCALPFIAFVINFLLF
jgi:hypothetical protein